MQNLRERAMLYFGLAQEDVCGESVFLQMSLFKIEITFFQNNN